MLNYDKALDAFHRNLDAFAYQAIDALIKEITDQGHKGRGGLIRSISHEIEDLVNDTELALYHAKHGIYLNKGTKPSRVPYTSISRRKGRRARGGTSDYIQALINWLKNYALRVTKDITSTAFAIAESHAKYGNPIPYRNLKDKSISSNGRRLRWLDYTLEQWEAKKFIDDAVEQATEALVEGALEIVINHFIENDGKFYSLN